MKKKLFFGLCVAAATVTGTAQVNAVKEAERAAKDGNYKAAMELLQPAFTNEENQPPLPFGEVDSLSFPSI